MVKNADSDAVWLKIKHTSEILNTTSPSKISRAILNGGNPPDLTFETLKCRVKRLLKKQTDPRNISPKRSPGSGRPRTVTTPKNLGRIKKMKKKSCRQVESYTSGANASTITKSSAHRLKQKIGHNFFR